MRLSRAAWVALSGLTWCIGGVSLLLVGIRLVVLHAQTSSLLDSLCCIADNREQAALFLVMGALFVGFIKGRFVLRKTVRRITARIETLSEPIAITHIYGKGYLFLIGGMVALGQFMRWIGLPEEVRGAIDVAIGSALINGASLYFRIALKLRSKQPHEI